MTNRTWLQIERPNIESLSISASKRDTFGLHAVPAVDLVHWNWVVWQHSPTVPLANSVNFGIDLNVPLAFDFSSLRILCLDNIQYDGRHPSPFVDPLVSIFKGTPNLEHLKLSVRFQIGGITLRGNFLESMYGVRLPFPGDRVCGLIEALCRQYRAAGGQLLRLKTLRLGYCCQILRHDRHATGPSHYIPYFTNPPSLEELHLEGVNLGVRDNVFAIWTSGFTLLSSRQFPAESFWTGVRKTTWPWGSGILLDLLWSGAANHLSQIIFRIAKPLPEDWIDGSPPTWASRARLNKHVYRRLRLRLGGLVLPTEFMTPQDGENFLLFVPWVKGLRVLKIRMPFLTSGRGRSYIRTFYRRMERMVDLRHLWFADGRGTWHGQVNAQGNVQGDEQGDEERNEQDVEHGNGQGQFVPEPYPTEVEFQRFSTLIAAKCPELVYLRILDRAWTITRPGLGDGKPVLKQLAAWQVEEELSEVFDFSMPKVV